MKALSLAMLTCGWDFTVVVTEDCEVRAFGCNRMGKLGLGTTTQHLPLAQSGGREVFDELVVMVAAGIDHSAAVVADGSVYTWGVGGHGQLGQVDP